MRMIDKAKGLLAIIDDGYADLDESLRLDFAKELRGHIARMEIEDSTGIKLPIHYRGYGRAEVGSHDWVMHYSDSGQGLSWPDDGRQPCNETLYGISFPTGAYIFGEGYPTDSFNEFFDRLKQVGAKYFDTRNHTLLYDLSVAKEAHDELRRLLPMYAEKGREEAARKRIENLQSEIDKIQSEVRNLKEEE